MTAKANQYQQERIQHWDKVARNFNTRKGIGGYYQNRLAQIYRFLIPPGLHILEVGCGQGDLLAKLQPSTGVGIDFSGEMVTLARARYPFLQFFQMDAHALSLQQQFDAIILSDLVNDLWDVQGVFEKILPLCHPRTRLIFNSYSHLWELPLKVAQKLRLSKPNLEQNWLTVEDTRNLLTLTGFEVVKYFQAILLPIYIPLIAPFLNRFLVHFWPFSHGALSNFIIARRKPAFTEKNSAHFQVSVVVPARNEADNIEAVFQRTPEMGLGTELIFVEGHSTDGSYAEIERCKNLYHERKCQILKQTGIGKGDAVRLGFSKASGDVMMILDADVTVPPEDLVRFYQALVRGEGEFINGVRLVYPLENQSMQYFNKIGNKFFGLLFSWLLGQPIKDTLCGTKVLWKQDYDLITANRSYFGEFDPFGDFDLIFGASKLNLKFVDLPIRYRARAYGETNIDRWRHGWLLLKMAFFASNRLKFI